MESNHTPADILVMGLGTIGRGALAAALADPDFEVMAAVDVDPDLVGVDAGEVVGAGACGVAVRADLAEALEDAARRPVAAIHATTSRVTQAAPQLRELARAGLHVSTCCEEMFNPCATVAALLTGVRRARSLAPGIARV